MINNKAFTLVELLATMAILSIIMMIAIPNIMSIMEKNRNTAYIEDAKKIVALAQYELNKNPSMEVPTRITLGSLDQTELTTGPNDGDYDLTRSYVVISYDGEKYTYSVQLVENLKSGKRIGIPEVDSERLYDDNAIKTLVKEGI